MNLCHADEEAMVLKEPRGLCCGRYQRPRNSRRRLPKGGDSAGPPTPTPPPPLGGLRPTVSCQSRKRPMLHGHQRRPKENFVPFAPQHYP